MSNETTLFQATYTVNKKQYADRIKDHLLELHSTGELKWVTSSGGVVPIQCMSKDAILDGLNTLNARSMKTPAVKAWKHIFNIELDKREMDYDEI